MDSMRYLFAALIAALIIFTGDFAQERSERPESAAAFIGFADLQGELSDERVDSDNDIFAGRSAVASVERDSELYAVAAEGTSSADEPGAGPTLGSAEAPLLPNQVCEAIRNAAEENRIPFGLF